MWEKRCWDSFMEKKMRENREGRERGEGMEGREEGREKRGEGRERGGEVSCQSDKKSILGCVVCS